MAGRGRGSWVLGICVALLVGCGGPSAPDAAPSDVRRMLDRRAEAVLDRDAKAYRATGAETDAWDNLRDVPLDSWQYRLTGFERSGARATATADLRYRIKGYDSEPLTTSRTLTLQERDGGWYVAAERPAKKATQQLWDQGPVTSVRGTHSLVLGVGRSERDRTTLRGYADLADRAVPLVRGAWPGKWPRRVVVLVPKSLDGMAGLLGSPASGYQGIAAVTTGEAGGSGSAPADRIIVNPEAYGVLGDFGKQVVLTHETTHVATRAHTSQATPLWLSEGFADWVGYRGTGRTAAQAAPELRRAVQREQLPGALPEDDAFGFSGDAGKLAQAYEGSWLACRMIADQWGEEKLTGFYEAVGAHKKRPGAVQDALRDVLDTTPEDFTARWRTYLRAELG
ncbi:hypothetical protein M4V62_30410 [Streptomyces durmitorensis]|uniref:Lipoprotein n=1 Tax=Streptomyces durmitorensis TaxID=319947 RepID=A0ABY4PZR1_9ACTN|nr:hypothetical protein [Streptomyces durmitorensis]UQT59021.1 hypothetical protein M4V62_30410 [Streptomyces durmitorensis]